MSLAFKPHPLLKQLLDQPTLALIERLHQILPNPLLPRLRPSLEGLTHTEPAWQVPALPDALVQRRVELLVAVSDTQALAAAQQSGSEALVLDFDDTFSPTLGNLSRAYFNLSRLKPPQPLLLLRPRPLFLPEAHLQVNGQPAVAALIDLSTYLTLVPHQSGDGRYLYLPKLETLEEAKVWDEVLLEAERCLELPLYSIRVGIQIETLAAAHHAEALLYTLRQRAFGLNAGRWDYVFSFIKTLGQDPAYLLPERVHLGMEQPFLQAYEQAIVQPCLRHGAQAIGGSAALVPAKNPGPTLSQVARDKTREARQGFHAAWVGHPDLVEVVREVFSQPYPSFDSPATPLSLTQVEPPQKLEPALVQDTLNLALSYLVDWLQGQGVMVRNGRTEDLATAELARAQLWQWVYYRVPLHGGGCLDAATYRAWREIETVALGSEVAAQAGELLDQMVLADSCSSYITLWAYPQLLRLEEGISA